MGRPKNKIKRKNLNTNLDETLLEKLKELSTKTGLPINRIIEICLEETLDKLRIKIN